MSSADLRSLGGAPALQGIKIRLSVSEGPLADPRFLAAMDLSTAFPFFKVGAAATGMIFPFGRTVVNCCTGSLPSLVAATVEILGCASRSKYVGIGVGSGTRRGG